MKPLWRRVEHRCCDAASTCYNPQRAEIKANSCYESTITYRTSFLCVHPSPGYCSKLTAVKDHIKNEGLDMVQFPREIKIRGWTNRPAFPFPCVATIPFNIMTR